LNLKKKERLAKEKKIWQINLFSFGKKTKRDEVVSLKKKEKKQVAPKDYIEYGEDESEDDDEDSDEDSKKILKKILDCQMRAEMQIMKKKSFLIVCLIIDSIKIVKRIQSCLISFNLPFVKRRI